MSDTPPEFDLKFLPSWLKEGPAEKSYADYEGRSDDSDRPRRDGFGDDRGGRGDRRGPRPGGPGGRSGGPQDRGGRGPRSGPGGPGGPRGGGPGGRRDDRGGNRDRDRGREPRPAAPPPVSVATAEVRIDFLPEAHGAENIAKQIKQSARAYPLFGTGRLFLEKPERHRVRITSLDPNVPLHQIGDGPISFDRAALERNAFRNLRDQYYKEEVTQGEPIKGNFANVARSQSTGVLIGPTNHHSYQPTLRRIFEERFSRRMSFQEFVQHEIEVVTDEQTINDWKEGARSSTTFATTREAEPISFKSAAEAEQHFRKTYLPELMKSAVALECSGQASRSIPDRGVSNAVRDGWERERAFPAGLVNYLRPYLLEAGLHFFKHRKRVLYISPIKPTRHASGQTLSTSVATILNTIELTPKCTRRILATKILGEQHDAPEKAEQKASLARDLHYLIHTGNVIEFHDGALELPLLPGGAPPPQGGGKGSPAVSAAKSAPPAPAKRLDEIGVGAVGILEAPETAAVPEDSIAGDFDDQLTGSEQLNDSAAPLAGDPLLPSVPEVSITESDPLPSEISPPGDLAPFEEPPLQAVASVPVIEPIEADQAFVAEVFQALPMTESLVDESASASETPAVALAPELSLSSLDPVEPLMDAHEPPLEGPIAKTEPLSEIPAGGLEHPAPAP